MAKTIELTPKSTKWIFIVNGTINTALGVGQILRAESMGTWISILGIILILVGPVMIIYGAILFNPRNKLTPKVHVDENMILIKEDVYKLERKIDWRNVKMITYKSFELLFLLHDDRIEKVTLQTNSDISIEIKKLIRKFADDRQIGIIDG